VYIFHRLKHARNVLCDEESRRKYDHWHRSGIAVPYEQWLELSSAVHTSLHWAARPRKELMLDCKKGEDSAFSVNLLVGKGGWGLCSPPPPAKLWESCNFLENIP